MLKIDVISVQPKMFEGFLRESIVARAEKKGLCSVSIRDLRDYAHDKRRSVDDKPYGGGPGMLMMCAPWFEAVETALGGEKPGGPVRVVMTTPGGSRFTQRDAEALSACGHIVFMCGHYEGFDARIRTLATDEYSIGDFVMTGGELAAAAMVDATVRLLPGALGGGAAATASESFGRDGMLEAPQYTRPPEFRGMKVPEVLLAGDHRRIEAWKQSESRRLTALVRPDLLES
jgi:tRNA (guanine37-N1)-methyltransferase